MYNSMVFLSLYSCWALNDLKCLRLRIKYKIKRSSNHKHIRNEPFVVSHRLFIVTYRIHDSIWTHSITNNGTRSSYRMQAAETYH